MRKLRYGKWMIRLLAIVLMLLCSMSAMAQEAENSEDTAAGKPAQKAVTELNRDIDGDGTADLNIDIDGDEISDLNTDIDGDGAADLNIDTNGDGFPDEKIDSDVNGKADICFLEGANGEHRSDDKEGLVFVTDGAFEEFLGIRVDGEPVEEENYAAIAGSTVIKLYPSYLKTLSAGEHKLTFVYTEEEASCLFRIAESSGIDFLLADISSFLFGFVVFLAICAIVVWLIIWKVIFRSKN